MVASRIGDAAASTYATIKRALEAQSANYTDRNFDVFLQGSYGNDTNIFAESDVDIVIRYAGAFYHNIDKLPPDQQSLFHACFPGGVTYSYEAFKNHVQAALRAAFGSAVKPGTKAFKIDANGSRRSADVVVAFNYRYYDQFVASTDQGREPGIAFLTSSGTRIANYPKLHSRNLTAKHQATNSNFKPLIRIFKNMRGKLVEDGMLGTGVAPSYFIEGLLYNVPNEHFSGSYSTIVLNILKWLHETTDRREFVCANEQYYLLRDGDPVCWPIANGPQFISAASAVGNFGQVNTNDLCVGSTCVTPTQFQAMVEAYDSSQGTGSGQTEKQPPSASQSQATSSLPEFVTSTSTPAVPPTITINGNNPAIIQVGDSYADLGATISEGGAGQADDTNLGLKTFLNGTLVSNIVIDTSQVATDTIDYVATDQFGLTATSTRTVIIEAAAVASSTAN